MRLSQFHLSTTKEIPADAEIVSHRLMLRSGMLRKLAAGIYTWTPLGLRVLRKVENIVREEMQRAGAIELLMPSIQPRELWDETGRWQKFGGQLLKIKDRKDQEYCYGPTHEEVISDFARNELKSYRQLPVNFFQIQTKFRDEIRPRFGVMRAREFLMKDAYSFHLSPECLGREYRNMYDAYTRVFMRLGLRFRAVQADTGAIGGSASHEFHVLADSGEDRIAFSPASEYAANVEMAESLAAGTRPAPRESLQKVPTPVQKTCSDVAALLGIGLDRTVKTIALMGEVDFVLALVRGDHALNEVKLGKLPGLTEFRLAREDEIADYLNATPGFLGPCFPRKPIRVVADHAVAALADFVVGANETGFHLRGVNWGRDLQEPDVVADIRNVEVGDMAPDGSGPLTIVRGIEVGHVFQLGQKYASAMRASVLDAQGSPVTPWMGCYGIGVSRIVAAAIEQNHDDAGIRWPMAMAPWTVALCIINPKNDAAVTEVAESLYAELRQQGIDVVLDDRGLRAGAMFADIELIGIPQRVVVSERGVAAGQLEYRQRDARDSEMLRREPLIQKIRELCSK